MPATQYTIVVVLIALFANAATGRATDSDIELGAVHTSRWRIGVVVRATGKTTGILATAPVPMDWPEQKVRIVSEEISPGAKVTYRSLDGVKQMLVSIPKMAAGDEATAVVTFEVDKHDIEMPAATADLQLPSKTAAALKKYLQPSPYIESNDSRVKSLAREITAGKLPAWQQTEAVFDWVRENVKYEFAEQIKPAIRALKDGVGDCEELSSLFIAICRANKIPARAVWVPGHTYPEFYLEDATGAGHWYPCQAAGEAHDFGRMPEDRPILQKGDNFKVPEEKGPQRYVKQFLRAASADANPEVRFVLERVKVAGSVDISP